MWDAVLQPAQVLAWAEGNPLSEYQKEYYRKQLLRQQARRDKLRAAGGLCQFWSTMLQSLACLA